MSAVNQPHANSEEADEFFGSPDSFDPVTGDFAEGEAPAAPGLDAPEDEAPVEETPGLDVPGEETPQEPAQPAPASEEAPAPPDEPQAAAESATQGPERGAAKREYIIFQPVALTAAVLRKMLSQMEAGQMPEAMTVFSELHRADARTDKEAVGLAYAEHYRALPESPELYAVTGRAFRKRTVDPEERPVQKRVRIV